MPSMMGFARSLNKARPRPSSMMPRPAPMRHRGSCCAVVAESPKMSEAERVTKARAQVTRRIKAFGESGNIKEAMKELASLAKLGVQPDTQAATALVTACSLRDMEIAQTVFDELFGSLLTPDEVAFAVLLRGYGALTPPDWTKLDATLTAMKMQHGIEPTAVSYNALFEVCVRTNDMDRGLDIMDRMADDGVEPDVLTAAIVDKRRVLRSAMKKIWSR